MHDGGPTRRSRTSARRVAPSRGGSGRSTSRQISAPCSKPPGFAPRKTSWRCSLTWTRSRGQLQRRLNSASSACELPHNCGSLPPSAPATGRRQTDSWSDSIRWRKGCCSTPRARCAFMSATCRWDTDRHIRGDLRQRRGRPVQHFDAARVPGARHRHGDDTPSAAGCPRRRHPTSDSPGGAGRRQHLRECGIPGLRAHHRAQARPDGGQLMDREIHSRRRRGRRSSA